MSAEEIPLRRTARVRLNPHLLRTLLALPAGHTVVAAQANNDPVGIDLIIQGEDLPEVEHHAESPYAHLSVEVVTLDDDREFLRVTSIEVPR